MDTNKQRGYFFVCLVLLIHVCCAQKSCEDWSYSGETGPEYWATLCPESECGGNSQSPIDISTLSLADYSLFDNYLSDTATISLSNTTLTVDNFNGAAGSIYYLLDQSTLKFNLEEIYFHTPSEHTLNSNQFDLEVQLLNQADDINSLGKYSIVSILYQVTEDASNDAFLDGIIPYLPSNFGDDVEFRLETPYVTPYGNDTIFYSYTGSLTIPPCTSDVQWYVQADVRKCTQEQLNAFLQKPGNNSRPVQPLNGRIISSNGDAEQITEESFSQYVEESGIDLLALWWFLGFCTLLIVLSISGVIAYVAIYRYNVIKRLRYKEVGDDEL